MCIRTPKIPSSIAEFGGIWKHPACTKSVRLRVFRLLKFGHYTEEEEYQDIQTLQDVILYLDDFIPNL